VGKENGWGWRRGRGRMETVTDQRSDLGKRKVRMLSRMEGR